MPFIILLSEHVAVESEDVDPKWEIPSLLIDCLSVIACP
jgi:hypothetical protein